MRIPLLPTRQTKLDDVVVLQPWLTGLGRLNIDYTFIRDGEVEKKSGFGQVYTYKEFCRIIEEAGFHGIEGYASAAQEPYRLASPGLFLVATKKQG